MKTGSRPSPIRKSSDSRDEEIGNSQIEIRASVERLARIVQEGGGGRASTAAMANLAEGIQGMVQHMRKEQQMVRDWMEAQSTQQQALQDTLRKLTTAAERNVTPLKRVESDDDWRGRASPRSGARPEGG